MANQDRETKLENELRIVRRLLWKIVENSGTDGSDPKLLALNPALNLLLQ
jgi:hypothetical protein